MRDYSALGTRLAAPSPLPGRLHQQGLLKDGSVTAAGMPLLCPKNGTRVTGTQVWAAQLKWTVHERAGACLTFTQTLNYERVAVQIHVSNSYRVFFC